MLPLTNIKLISFDLDDTLWPCMQTICLAEARTYEWLQQHAPVITDNYTPDTMREKRMAWIKANPEYAHDLTRVRLSALQAHCDEFDLPHEIAEQANAIFREARNWVEPFDEVIQGLKQLKQNYRLVAVSNGNAQVEKTPLQGLFDAAFMAEQVGAAKPHPALFQASVDRFGVRADECLHVGDDPVRDIEAAANFGMKTAWMNRNSDDWVSHIARPDIVLSDLNDLLIISYAN
jgi:2-haloalkanoic acid dehalogenase type II